jgi:cytochrome c biogenesis protein CcmG/thiol:disulfide interchange protein DsbE
LPSTRSSASSPGAANPRPSRAAIVALVVASIAIPAGVLALIVTHDSGGGSPPGTTSTTLVSPTDERRARVGTPAPDFALRSSTGRNVTLSGLRGKPVVITFFASWCNPCEKELPVLTRVQHAYAKHLRVIGVSFQDLASDSKRFIRRLHVTFPALLDDPDGPIGRRYGVRSPPQTIFVDARGIVRGRVYGETTFRDLQPAIADLLAGRNVRPI